MLLFIHYVLSLIWNLFSYKNSLLKIRQYFKSKVFRENITNAVLLHLHTQMFENSPIYEHHTIVLLLFTKRTSQVLYEAGQYLRHISALQQQNVSDFEQIFLEDWQVLDQSTTNGNSSSFSIIVHSISPFPPAS